MVRRMENEGDSNGCSNTYYVAQDTKGVIQTLNVRVDPGKCLYHAMKLFHL